MSDFSLVNITSVRLLALSPQDLFLAISREYEDEDEDTILILDSGYFYCSY